MWKVEKKTLKNIIKLYSIFLNDLNQSLIFLKIDLKSKINKKDLKIELI
jgi:hypothetical protein